MAGEAGSDRIVATARALQREIDEAGFGPTRLVVDAPAPDRGTALATFDDVVDDPDLRATCRKLFEDGHYARAVEDAFKLLNNVVKERSGLTADGSDLMNRAFSPKDPHLKLNDLKSESKRCKQLGYMQILSGAMTGIRNPRAHEHEQTDEAHVALELLAMANHLLRETRAATKARRAKKSK